MLMTSAHAVQVHATPPWGWECADLAGTLMAVCLCVQPCRLCWLVRVVCKLLVPGGVGWDCCRCHSHAWCMHEGVLGAGKAKASRPCCPIVSDEARLLATATDGSTLRCRRLWMCVGARVWLWWHSVRTVCSWRWWCATTTTTACSTRVDCNSVLLFLLLLL